jgi:hypothetical protein
MSRTISSELTLTWLHLYNGRFPYNCTETNNGIMNYRISWRSYHETLITNTIVGFQVLKAASTKVTALWDTAPCSLVEVDRRFMNA